MNNIQQFAMNMINQRMQQDPNFAKNQNAQSMIDILRSGDEAAGVQLANNILNSMGMSKEQALNMAAQRFGFRR